MTIFKRTIFHILLVSIFFVGGIKNVLGQSVKILEEKLISGNINYPLNEPHLISDPNDPNNLAVASILTKKWTTAEPESHIVLLQSWDAGKTWEENHFDKNIMRAADPWLAMNKKGTLLLTSLNKIHGKSFVFLLVFISPDGGKTWQEEILNLGSAHDRQSIVVDPRTQDFIIVSSKFNYDSNNKWVTGLSITRLTSNGSLRESNWHALSNIDINNGTPIINSKNELLIPYVDYLVNNKWLKTRRSWLIKSPDLGRTFRAPVLINEDGSFPRILIDTTDHAIPLLHSLRTDGTFREYLGFTVQTSTDEGYTWTDEVDVDHYNGENPYIRSPEWAINNAGVIGVFFCDRRASKDSLSHDLFFAYSKDLPKSFEPATRVSSKSSKPNPEKNGKVDERWPTGGDYYGMEAILDGKFRVVWVDHRNGPPQLYYALIEIAYK